MQAIICFAELCPGKKIQAEVYCDKVESISGLLQLYAEVVLNIKDKQ